MDSLVPMIVIPTIFIGLPWIILHYVTRWKTNASLTAEDENLLDDLYSLARRLDDRMNTIERILAAENPNWNGQALDRPSRTLLEKSDRSELDDLTARLERARSDDRSPVGRA